MSQQQPQTLRGILAQALVDDDLLQQLAADPLGTLRDAGVGTTSASIKNWLGVPEATDEELVQMIYNGLQTDGCSGASS